MLQQGHCGWAPLTAELSPKGLFRTKIALINNGDKAVEFHRVDVDTVEVEQQLAELVQMTVPAFPVSPMVCDGEYVELQIEGGYSHLRIGWWSIAPKGAERVADFAYWLRDLGLGGDDDEDGDCEDEEN